MAKKEVNTDLWVYELLKEAKISDKFTAQGSNIKEIHEALQTASKRGTGKVGFPEYVGVVKNFLIVIEDKADTNKHIDLTDKEIISEEVASVCDYAVNGALFYGKHLAKNTNYKEIIAIGISGNEKNHKITPIYIDDRGNYKVLDDLETLISFSEKNIDEYYTKEILKEDTQKEKETAEILKDASELHEDLRNYGNLEEKSKPLRANVSPQVKKNKLLSQFSIIRDNVKINEVNPNLGKTPLKHFTEFLYESIYHSIKYNNSSEDYLGRFYGEFMSYSGGDGQNLGIVLTPKHITELFCDLLDLKPSDKILDPCCGTAGFLIAAMHNMVSQTDDEGQIKHIKKHQLFGIEEQSYMFTIATTNMILRGDGKSNLENGDFLAENPAQLQLKGCNIGMMNPPYSMGSKQNPNLYEINFTRHLLDSLVEDGCAAIIVPQSTFTGKTKDEQKIKEEILKNHTLEGVITLNKNTFYGVGTNPCIAIFTAHNKHPKNKICKFINFENDGYIVSKHIGLIDDGSHKDKKQHLLDVWFGKNEAPTKFCVETTVEATDEWLHSFYYFNDEIPSEEDFRKAIADYLTFEVNMITHGRGYLFGIEENEEEYEIKETVLKVAESGEKYE